MELVKNIWMRCQFAETKLGAELEKPSVPTFKVEVKTFIDITFFQHSQFSFFKRASLGQVSDVKLKCQDFAHVERSYEVNETCHWYRGSLKITQSGLIK